PCPTPSVTGGYAAIFSALSLPGRGPNPALLRSVGPLPHAVRHRRLRRHLPCAIASRAGPQPRPPPTRAPPAPRRPPPAATPPASRLVVGQGALAELGPQVGLE